MTTPPAVLERLAGLRALVIGEAMLDSYVHGTSGRLCREAPVPIVDVASRVDAPGGAANVAANLAALGAATVLLSACGRDVEGERLLSVLHGASVSSADVAIDGERGTLAKQRIFCGGQLLVRFDAGTTSPVGPATEAALVRRLSYWFPRVDAVVVADYDYGIITDAVLDCLAELQRNEPRVLVVDSKRLTRYRDARITAAKPNFDQACALLEGLHPNGNDRGAVIRQHAGRLFELTGAGLVVVTLDADGAMLLERGRPAYRAYARPARHAGAAGAGDTFGAALALALAAGAETPAAVDLASAAAAVVVAKEGTAVCTPAELRQSLTGKPKFLGEPEALAELAAMHRMHGRRIVLTSGCFDILHRGHVAHLNQAKELGDLLVVAVNSDAGVRRLKGPGRPVNSLEDRIAVLAALSCVDHVVPFDDLVPDELIRAARPDVFVKGGNYSGELLPEGAVVEACGGSVHILPLIDDRSTTGLIRRIRHAPDPELVG